MPTVYVQIRFPFTNSFPQIIFRNSLSTIFFYKFNIANSFSRINFRIWKSSKKFVRISTTSFWFLFAKSVLCCEWPVLYLLTSSHSLLLTTCTQFLKIYVLSCRQHWILCRHFAVTLSVIFFCDINTKPYWIKSISLINFPWKWRSNEVATRTRGKAI